MLLIFVELFMCYNQPVSHAFGKIKQQFFRILQHALADHSGAQHIHQHDVVKRDCIVCIHLTKNFYPLVLFVSQLPNVQGRMLSQC